MIQHMRDLVNALETYVNDVPAFRAEPVGAPGSPERMRQLAHMSAEAKAVVVISRARAAMDDFNGKTD